MENVLSFSPFKIAVISGKGGTGKTTISLNLAFSLLNSYSVALVDADVEEPNLHLFLNPIFTDKKKVYIFTPLVDKEKCTYCGKCAEVCAYNALAILKDLQGTGEFLLFSHLCHGCRACKILCPEKAIKEGKRELGEIREGFIEINGKRLLFEEGRLKIGEVLSPFVIRELKKDITQREDVQVAIFDGPPGASCPVLELLKEMDFALLVTEATPFGLHDLQVAIQVVKHLGISSGILINKAEKDFVKRIYALSEKEGIPVLMEIPFKKEFAEVYSRGRLFVQEFPEYQEKFIKVFKRMYEK